MSIEKLPTSASLKQVMDKFEEISLADFSSLHITSGTELPANGKENQIYVITDNPVNSFVVTSDHYYTPESDTIGVYLGYSSPEPSTLGSLVSINNKNMVINYNILKFAQAGTQLQSYIYTDTQWKIFTVRELIMLSNKTLMNLDVYGGFSNFTTSGIVLLALNAGSAIATTTNAFDLTPYTKAVIKCTRDSQYNTSGTFAMRLSANEITSNTQTGTSGTFTFDISSLTGVNKLSIYVKSQISSGIRILITDITLS